MRKITLLFFLLHALHCTAQLEIPFKKMQIMRSHPAHYPTWGNVATFIPTRTLTITSHSITFEGDRMYRLKIIGRTLMPSRNMVYECRDQLGEDVRVFLIDQEKMYVYYKTYHLLIHFLK